MKIGVIQIKESREIFWERQKILSINIDSYNYKSKNVGDDMIIETICQGLWNGVVGKVLYGDADIGITNIDITYTRYMKQAQLFSPNTFCHNILSTSTATYYQSTINFINFDHRVQISEKHPRNYQDHTNSL